MAKLTKEKVTGCLKSSALTLATLAGVIGGVIFGMALRTREGKTLGSKLLFFFVKNTYTICNFDAYTCEIDLHTA